MRANLPIGGLVVPFGLLPCGLLVSISDLGRHCRDCQPLYPGCCSGSNYMRAGLDVQWNVTQLASPGGLFPLGRPDTQT